MISQLLEFKLLLFSIGAITLLIITYLFITFNKFKDTASQSIAVLKNELLKEKIVRYHHKKNQMELRTMEESTQIKFRSIQLQIVNTHFTLTEIFKNLS